MRSKVLRMRAARAKLAERGILTGRTPILQRSLGGLKRKFTFDLDAANRKTGPGKTDPETGIAAKFAGATSTSHKKEYLQFLRAAKNKKKCPAGMSANIKTNAQDIFRKWLSNVRI